MTGPSARVRSPQPESSAEGASSLTIRIGPQELVIRRRYEAASIVNDVLIGLWFLIGSVFFFFDSLTRAGTVLFVIGSVEMLIRPVVRLARHLHLQRLHRGSAGGGRRGLLMRGFRFCCNGGRLAVGRGAFRCSRPPPTVGLGAQPVIRRPGPPTAPL